MPKITEQSTVEEVAAIVSDALKNAGITATLSGGSAVTIYSNNAYLSRDLDFVTSAMVADLAPALKSLGFETREFLGCRSSAIRRSSGRPSSRRHR